MVSVPTSVAAWLLLFGAIPFVLGVIVGGYRWELFSISTKSIFAFTYVLIFPMMFCQWCYLEIVAFASKCSCIEHTCDSFDWCFIYGLSLSPWFSSDFTNTYYRSSSGLEDFSRRKENRKIFNQQTLLI